MGCLRLLPGVKLPRLSCLFSLDVPGFAVLITQLHGSCMTCCPKMHGCCLCFAILWVFAPTCFSVLEGWRSRPLGNLHLASACFAGCGYLDKQPVALCLEYSRYSW